MPMPNLESAAEKNLPAGLYLVATPIGNMGDITLRALAALRQADEIWCEDTRVGQKLLRQLGIKGHLQACHQHNEAAMAIELPRRIAAGKKIIFISDAGSPGIADPGAKLMQAARQAGLYATIIPGASAVIAAAQLAGLAMAGFCFLGFLPAKSGERRRRLHGYAGLDVPLLLYEAPHRLLDLLADIAATLADRPIVVLREITKKFEEYHAGTPAQLAEYFTQTPPRGELVVIIQPAQEDKIAIDPTRMLRDALQTMSVKDAVQHVAFLTGQPKRSLYQLALALAEEQS